MHNAKQLGAADGFTIGTSTTVGSDGSIYVAGYTSEGLNGNTQQGEDDSFIAKYF